MPHPRYFVNTNYQSLLIYSLTSGHSAPLAAISPPFSTPWAGEAPSPPTALIVSSSPNYIATLHFLLNRGIRVPQDCSLVCTDDDPHFTQCRPSVAHIRWSHRPVVNRIARWAKNISLGKEDTRQTMIDAEFVEAGTVGAAPVAR